MTCDVCDYDLEEGDAGYVDPDGIIFCDNCKEYYMEIMEDCGDVE